MKQPTCVHHPDQLPEKFGSVLVGPDGSVLAERRKVLTEMESKALLSAFHTVRLKTHLIDAGTTLAMSNAQLSQAVSNVAQRTAPLQQDPALVQQATSANISQQIGREAAVLAFNDVFFLIGTLAAVTFAALLVPWVINKIRGRNPLAKELAFIEAMRARTKP